MKQGALGETIGSEALDRSSEFLHMDWTIVGRGLTIYLEEKNAPPSELLPDIQSGPQTKPGADGR